MTNRDTAELVNIGLELFKAGRLQEAWETLAQVVDEDPQNFMALRLMGVIAAQCGNLPLALELTNAALEIHPNDASAHLDYANMLGALGKTSESIQQYDESIRLNPDNYLAYYNKGNLLRDIGESQSALAAFETAIWRNPSDQTSRLNKGLLEFDIGDFVAAIKTQKSGLCFFPSDKDQLHAIARTYEAKAEGERAKLFYVRSISIATDYAAALISYSNFLNALSDTSSSLYASRAVILNPNEARAYVNLGVAIYNKQNFEAALWCHSRAAILNENLAEAHVNRGNALLQLARFQEALESHNRAILVEEAFAEALWNKSTLLLRLGNLKEGFALYDWRFRIKEKTAYLRTSHIPEFNGQEVQNKSVRLYPEQGFGDLIQFARYAKLLSEKGAKVILEVYPELEELFRTLDDQIEVILNGDELPITDLICPLLNLPHLLGTQLDTIPWPGPYLSAPSKGSASLKKCEKPRIGIVWRGNPAHKNDRSRSIAFDTFKDLLNVPLTFVALQKGVTSDDLVELKSFRNVHVVEDQLHDFADTARFIEALDLVITVDTSVAHLAGAMGKEVWILLAFMPDYRWMMDRTDTPWYPSARLYRQDVSRTWDPVLEQVKADLKIRFGKSWGDSQ